MTHTFTCRWFKMGGTTELAIAAQTCNFLPTTSSLLTIVGFLFFGLPEETVNDWTT
ncbi:hypothetical protein [Ktedonospora formicarum]|uniref:hypothetical protein n=1 Tax=Ktedonospora formicarum TaxID=2778364 RepID=UPI001C68CBEB|nr:hypothetical protein [Ktedonospora formicarum]